MGLDIRQVRTSATGRWAEVMAQLAPELDEAQKYMGSSRHLRCPICGKTGTNAFRLDRRYFPKCGGAMCGGCGADGALSDGFKVLQRIKGWSFPKAVEEVGSVLGLASEKGRVLAMDKAGAYEATGKVVSCGNRTDMKFPAFVVEIADRNGVLTAFKGAALERRCVELGLKAGDNATVRFEGKQTVEGKGGRKFTRNVFSVIRLPTDEEQAESEAEAKAKAEACTAAQKAVWTSSAPVTQASSEMFAPDGLLAHSAVREYLKARGIEVDALPKTVFAQMRAAMLTAQHDGKTVEFPSMVCAVRDLTGYPRTIHRTFLVSGGKKAPMACPKMLMPTAEAGASMGASIHFGEVGADGVLGLAEGIETALSAVVGTGLPCWSCVSANGLKAVQLPESARIVLIWEDKDASGVGQAAAQALRERLAAEGRLVIVMSIDEAIPEGSKGVDWNDVLVHPENFPKARMAFPKLAAR